MCEYFVKADPISYEQRTRTIRIHGVLTSIRLENMAWDILAEMAEAEGCTTNSLIVQFHDEIMAHRGEVPNFASFLRVTCMRFLHRELMTLERTLERISGHEALPARMPPIGLQAMTQQRHATSAALTASVTCIAPVIALPATSNKGQNKGQKIRHA